MRYTCLSDIALFINGIETAKAYRFRVANTIYAVDSVFLFLESVPTLFGAPAAFVKTPPPVSFKFPRSAPLFWRSCIRRNPCYCK